jgi:hypothetical protein
MCLAAAFGLTANAVAEQPEPLHPTQVFTVKPPFLEKKNRDDDDEKVAEDLSGAACAPSGICLAINDQSRFAQPFTIDKESGGDGKGRIRAGEPVTIIGKNPSAATLGAAPAVDSCPGEKDDFRDLDGEGVAYAAPYFYIVGSHGCTRKDGDFLLSSFILARLRADQVSLSGAEEDASVETTYRLADALRAAPMVGAFFGRDLNDDEGLNIEGLAVVGSRLFVGLRAPSIKGEAFLVSAPIDRLFASGHDPLDATPEVVPLALGHRVGIRDLAALPDGRLLVLAGPTQEQADIPYSLFIVEPKVGGEAKQIAKLEDVYEKKDKRAKAEAVTILDLDPLRILVFFDGPKNGAPREFVISR